MNGRRRRLRRLLGYSWNPQEETKADENLPESQSLFHKRLLSKIQSFKVCQILSKVTAFIKVQPI